jgi:hypothetical protein
MTNIIQTTLELIRQRLNESLRNAAPVDEEPVILSTITDHEGNAYKEAGNKLVMLLANIQHETVANTDKPVTGNAPSALAPPLYIDLFVLFLANFYDKNYPAGLGMISETISFFQQHPRFTRENLPDLDPEIDKLTFEMLNLDLAELHSLMSILGAKCLPSVYYKVRMIPFEGAGQQKLPS